ncbi:MAG: YggT family protein [Succinivibrio sp.]
MQLVIMLIEAFVILFELRALMQSSSADYYHPVTQAVIKLTEPVVKLLPFKNASVLGIYYCGFVVGFVIAQICVIALFKFSLGAMVPMWLCLLLGTLMTIKCFGYLLLVLLIAQALCSWLPNTRAWSMYFSQITYPITAPVQKIIPPIGMIDISLMIVMLVIFAIDRLFYALVGPIWLMI